MKLIKKTFKLIGIIALALFLTANIFIILSGKFYIYKGVVNTYLVGKKGPTIYDLDVFEYSTILPAEKKELLPHSKNHFLL